MQHDVEHHRVIVLLDERGHLRLEVEGAGAAQEVVQLARAVLERELDVVEPRVLQRPDAGLVQAYAGRDQVRVEPERVRFRDDELEIIARQWLTAGETELDGPERPRFAQYLQPLSGGQLLRSLREVDRVVAKGAVKRAAVGELQQ
jgi:hypothetical protein